MGAKNRACKIENCKRPYRAKGFCDLHFKKWRRGEMPKKTRYKLCTEENCRKPRGRWGVCVDHFREKYGPKEGAPATTPATPAAPAPTAEATA